MCLFISGRLWAWRVRSVCSGYTKYAIGSKTNQTAIRLRSMTLDFWRDALWQMHCQQILTRPPDLHIEDRATGDKFYRWLESTWRWQQLPLAIVLYAVGGWGFVFWGVCLRVAVSLTGHWCVVHIAHTRGERPYPIENIAIDGRNVRGLGLLTFGECWHNNHHAFPRSARMSHSADEIDPGWLVIRALIIMGLAWNVTVPDLSSGSSRTRLEQGRLQGL
jgi:fatty-acid desaturase